MHRSDDMSALRFRLVTFGLVAACLLAARLLVPEGELRARHQLHFVLALGYGHLLGGSLGALRRGLASPLTAAFVGATLAAGAALYATGVSAWPGLAFGLLALSVWHFTENDRAMARALRRRGELGGLPRGVRAHAWPLAAAAAVVGAALGVAPDATRLGDHFAATTLFHLAGWLVFLVARGASRVRLLALHAPPLALCGAVAAAPEGSLTALRDWVFSPALYLYWASLHVVHTALLRRARAA